MISDVDHFFHVYLWRNVNLSFLLVFLVRWLDFVSVLSCRSCLYILDINLIRFRICSYFLQFYRLPYALIFKCKAV